ncbi:MAG TPA: hypothetical protein PLQ78_00945 [Flavipsychrobacter sp.]|jgi:Tfp pilus assembly protein PilV|nr:hypothetical protein [Flavipsychrobacter sp.]
MKRILFALSVLILSNVAYAQKAEKSNDYQVVMAQEKEQIHAKYSEIKASLEKNDFTKAKQQYADAVKLMENSIASDQKFLRKTKSADSQANLEYKIKTKTNLLAASKPFETVDLAKEGARYAIYIMEFAGVCGR